jgi:hypothetical protein
MSVVNHTNQVVGTISRKDLMGFAIEERLEHLLTNPPRKLSRSVVLALRKNYVNQKPKKMPADDDIVAQNNCEPVQADIENTHL